MGITSRSVNYVGLYNNCTEIPVNTADYRVFKFYDKILIVSNLDIKINPFYVKHTGQNKFNKLILELDSSIATGLDFDNNFINTNEIINGFVDDVIYMINEHMIKMKDDGTVHSQCDSFLNNERYRHYFMHYLKIRTVDGNEDKFHNFQFFKLSDDLVEMLEI